MNKYLQWIYLDKSISKKIHTIASFFAICFATH